MDDDPYIESRQPDEILAPSCLAAYGEAIDLVWREILRLNGYLFVLEKLLDFPSDPGYLFLGHDRQSFLQLVKIAFTEGSILIISKLTTSGRDRFTLELCKNRISEMVKPEYQNAFNRMLKKARFSTKVRVSRTKVNEIRNYLIGHLIVDKDMRPILSVQGFPFEELKQMTAELTSLFDLLCFGCKRMTLPVDYSPIVQHHPDMDSRPDIEYFLDLIIQDSTFFRMPEESPYWEMQRKALPNEVISRMNEYRRKFGKPEV